MLNHEIHSSFVLDDGICTPRKHALGVVAETHIYGRVTDICVVDLFTLSEISYFISTPNYSLLSHATGLSDNEPSHTSSWTLSNKFQSKCFIRYKYVYYFCTTSIENTSKIFYVKNMSIATSTWLPKQHNQPSIGFASWNNTVDFNIRLYKHFGAWPKDKKNKHLQNYQDFMHQLKVWHWLSCQKLEMKSITIKLNSQDQGSKFTFHLGITTALSITEAMGHKITRGYITNDFIFSQKFKFV